MRELNPNEPAFARSGFYTQECSFDPSAGMTKREYMATAILAGLLSTKRGDWDEGNAPKNMANLSVMCADKLLEVLAER